MSIRVVFSISWRFEDILFPFSFDHFYTSSKFIQKLPLQKLCLTPRRNQNQPLHICYVVKWFIVHTRTFYVATFYVHREFGLQCLFIVFQFPTKFQQTVSKNRFEPPQTDNKHAITIAFHITAAQHEHCSHAMPLFIESFQLNVQHQHSKLSMQIGMKFLFLSLFKNFSAKKSLSTVRW